MISVKWLDKYKKYIFYNELKYNSTPNPDDDHLQKNPG
jgi:hypothetical protein